MEDDLFPLICNTSREMNTCCCKSQSLWGCYVTRYHLVYQFLNVSALLCCSHKEPPVSLQPQAFISQSWTYSLSVTVFCFAWPNVFLACDLSWRNSFCWGHDILTSDPGVKEGALRASIEAGLCRVSPHSTIFCSLVMGQGPLLSLSRGLGSPSQGRQLEAV